MLYVISKIETKLTPEIATSKIETQLAHEIVNSKNETKLACEIATSKNEIKSLSRGSLFWRMLFLKSKHN